jgi:hypothetical protein
MRAIAMLRQQPRLKYPRDDSRMSRIYVLPPSTGKKDEIAVGITNDECASAPWFCLECLMK